MRVVLDSSVVIAAHVTRAGVCAELYEEVLQHHELVLSRYILDEVRRKLTYKFLFPERLVDEIERSLERAAQLVTPATPPQSACRDHDDLPILGTAIAGAAAVLVTVDRDLHVLGRYGSTVIIKPGEFWSQLK